MRIAIAGVGIFWVFLIAALMKNDAAIMLSFAALVLLNAIAFADGRKLWK